MNFVAYIVTAEIKTCHIYYQGHAMLLHLVLNWQLGGNLIKILSANGLSCYIETWN